MTKHFLRAASLITLALLVADCQLAADAPSNAEDKAAIKAVFDKHSAALGAGDAAAFTALFSDKAVMMPPDRGALNGKESIRYGLRRAFELFAAKISGESAELEIAGDWAYAKRTCSMTVTAKTGGEQMDLMANWLDILKRQPDGSWKIYLEMVTSDRPLPGAN